MNHTIKNILIYLTIIALSVIFIFLSYKIITRPHPIYEELAETAANTDTTSFPEVIESKNAEESTVDDADSAIMYGKTASTVNIRELPSTDSRVLAKVEKDFTFKIVDILDNGWTQIEYEDSTAYIFSAFVILVQGN